MFWHKKDRKKKPATGHAAYCQSLLLKNLKPEDWFLISNSYYFQPFLTKWWVDITIFILYMGFIGMKLVGAWCRISSGPICFYSYPAVTQPYQP
jgi:hypothetical protein